MPPRKDAIEAPYPSCNRAAFATRSAGRKGRLCAMGGASARNGIAPAGADYDTFKASDICRQKTCAHDDGMM